MHHSSIQYNYAASRSNLYFITHKNCPMKRSEAKVSHHKSEKETSKITKHSLNITQYNMNTQVCDTWEALINTEIRQ